MIELNAIPIKNSWIIKRMPFYYGWVILLMGTLGMIMTAPGQTYAVSIFIEHFISELGVSRSLVSALYTVGTLGGSFTLPFIGRQIDRRGPRIMMTLIVICFGLACIYMGFVYNALMLGVGFFLIRMLGQGSLGLVGNNVINQWWMRRRGTMIGLSGMAVALLGFGFMPSLINTLISLFGWRSTYIIFGLILSILFAVSVYAFVRDRPENYGLQPDGFIITDAPTAHPLPVQANEEDWTLAEARRTPVFWLTAIGAASISMLATGLFFHMVSIFNDNGLSATAAAGVYVPIAITTALINLAGGILIDRIPVRFLLATALFLQTGALFMAQFLRGTETVLLYGLILGMTMGLMGTINGAGWAKYFGRKHLGSIGGLATTILVLGSALGPMPFGIARDWFGSYTLILTLCALIPFSLALANLLVKSPAKSN